MSPRSAALRVVLPVWAAALVGGGVFGLFSVGSTDAGAPAPAAGVATPTTTVAAPPATELPVATTPPTAAPPAPGRAAAPAAGTYRYLTTTTRSDGKQSQSERASTVTRVGDDADGVVQQQTMTLVTGSGELGATATAVYTAKGVVVRRWVVRLYGGTFTCDWQPTAVDRPLTLGVGTSWSFDVSCAGTVSGGQLDGSEASLRHRASRKVTGTKTEQLADRAVETATIARTEDLEVTSGGLKSTTRTEGTEQYAASLGVVTSSDDTLTVDSFGQKTTGRTTITLVALP